MSEFQILGQDAPVTGKRYWRSLDELADSPQFREWAEREFPQGAAELDGPSRRSVLKLLAASFGLAGVTACRRPVENILPHSRGVAEYIHGNPVYYATVMPMAGEATGLLVKTHDGRPTKIEGNPEHPMSLGATNIFHQAAILQLYDPDRAFTVKQGGQAVQWNDFLNFARTHFSGAGNGLRVLSARVDSPSFDAVRQHFTQRFPQARWAEYEPSSYGPASGLSALPNYEKADVVVSLDCDFLGGDGNGVLACKQFSRKRRLTTPQDNLSRLYVVENRMSVTGGAADHRMRARTSEIVSVAAELAAEVGAASGLTIQPNNDDRRRRFIAAVARELKGAQGRSLVVVGPRQPAEVHALAAAINRAFAAPDAVIYRGAPAPANTYGIQQLAGEMAAGAVRTLVILGGNPVHDAPVDLQFPANLRKVETSIHVGEDENETAASSTWHIPEAHFLESWGDARSADGTVAIQQPAIAPLHDGKTKSEVLAAVCGYKDQGAYAIVRNYWLAQLPGDKEKAWRKALHDGIVPAATNQPAGGGQAAALPQMDTVAISAALSAQPAAENNLEVTFYASATVFDGRFANNAWLQELPDPMTKLTWDNAALISPATARALGLVDGEVVLLRHGNYTHETPVLIQPGHADGSISLTLGYGRPRAGRVGRNVGRDVYPFRTSATLAYARGVTLTKTLNTYALAVTQGHHSLEGRPIAREATLEDYRRNPRVIADQEDKHPPLLSLHREFDYTQGNQWGMAIDLTACTGCNSCMIACQAENNIPVVGKEQVLRGREMHWIRIDRYFSGPVDDPEVITEPVPCMQCENAPCENVCPVAATVHSPEGLNDMAYNRCVGTRYCSNNCPYKVRRFNFFNWSLDIPELKKMAFNPDVSVRMRGVMEKCTYCVQRIQTVKIQAKAEGRRPIRDGEITPACAQACPADAIVFGNVNDPNSRVSQWKTQDRNFAMLAELNTKPRTTYLAKIRNPNPELA